VTAPADGLVYQVYPRSFQDSDGDGVGDLAGIERRLDHIAGLGASALWLSPVYPSPGADLGYDVSDFTGVDPLFGTLEDLDRLIAEAHERGLSFLLDLVPSHTSVEHPWFTQRPELYVRVDGDRPDPPNNWTGAFGGPAWSRDPRTGDWYLHSFYPEQADLDWRNPAVAEAIQEVVRFWLDRGVDGFRLDAIDRLLKDPELRDDPPATAPFGLPLPEWELGRDLVHSRDAPDIGLALAAIREAAGDALLVGEVYLPRARVTPYLDHVDAAFSFDLFHARWEAAALSSAIAGNPGAAWVISNHDFPRAATRFGPENARAAALLLLTLPGLVFVYQGEEIGQLDGGPHEPAYDRAGRDAHRRPVQWEPEPRTGGFSDGEPWLPPVDPLERNVAEQTGDPGSLLELYRRAIALREELDGPLELVPSHAEVLAYTRGKHLVAVNTASDRRPAPGAGQVVLRTHTPAASDATLAPHEAVVLLPDRAG
jgi:alpha-glucosidase